MNVGAIALTRQGVFRRHDGSIKAGREKSFRSGFMATKITRLVLKRELIVFVSFRFFAVPRDGSGIDNIPRRLLSTLRNSGSLRLYPSKRRCSGFRDRVALDLQSRSERRLCGRSYRFSSLNNTPLSAMFAKKNGLIAHESGSSLHRKLARLTARTKLRQVHLGGGLSA